MKSLKFALVATAGAFLLTFSANAQTKAAVAKAPTEKKNMEPSKVSWKESVHNFGEIEKGTPVSHDFSFKNTTDQTILITRVKASCGCTATKYTKTPIKPGQTANITATYNARNPGNFNKTITVSTNDTDAKKVLSIKGKVLTPKVKQQPVAKKQ
ncbi:DUF1573 domain-containing protein [uncultured Flavobacterium sp.]|uniref:DUF1573 domain-containing protein n=1 Tax=uncultured Flavobacterium sp. TaxID=165435 RepID=UPI0025DE25C7|nr:DUF1573 domain-containing protein [uncultured Flavobacterium sp.]